MLAAAPLGSRTENVSTDQTSEVCFSHALIDQLIVGIVSAIPLPVLFWFSQTSVFSQKKGTIWCRLSTAYTRTIIHLNDSEKW